MALSPQTIRQHQFKAARRGYDQTEVDQFRADAADALEAAQNEATAMEARARAAVARLQELSRAHAEGGDSAESSAAGDGSDDTARPVSRRVEVHPSPDESETISRTLLLAQRTADTTVADAQGEADRLLADARDQASSAAEAARAEREQLLEGAKDDARRAGESERVRVEGQVQALLARKDFLESDVDHLEQFIAAQRERLTEAAAELSDMVQRVPNGLADMRRPLLSAAADEPREPPAEDADIAEITRVAEGDGASDDEAPAQDDPAAEDDTGGSEGAQAPTDETGDIWARRDSVSDDPTPGSSERLFSADERER